ncbi:MAG: hypothetical protein ABWU13_04905, partial [Limnospira maxima]
TTAIIIHCRGGFRRQFSAHEKPGLFEKPGFLTTAIIIHCRGAPPTLYHEKPGFFEKPGFLTSVPFTR